jgi:hypothetical protein
MALAQSRRWEPAGIDPAPRPGPPIWRPVALMAAAVCGMTAPPLLLAAVQTPAGRVFTGYLVIARDAYVYQAMWRAGWQGAWLFHPAFTTESLPGILLYPWYLWTGHLLGWAAGPWLYHLLRLAAGVALLVAIDRLTRELFRPRVLRRWAFTLAALGGGVGVLLPHELRLGPLTTRATEMISPGSSVADVIAMAPHLPWAMALMCWLMVVGLRLRRAVHPRLIASGLCAVVGLQLIYPQLAILAVGALLIWSAVRRYRQAFWFSVGAATLQLPYLAYLLWTWQTSPEALRVVRPALEVGDLFGFLVLSHLVATLLIVVALWSRRLRGDLLLPALWIAGMTIFMFAPVISGTLGRTFIASSIPFGLCATPGLLVVIRRLQGIAWRRRVLALMLAASSLFGVYSLAEPFKIAAFQLDPHAEYESRNEAALLSRLAPKTTAEDAVLSTYLDGLFVPAQTNARAFNGHPEMTIDAARKSSESLAFFTSWSTEQREAFLQANGIDYLMVTDPHVIERLAGDRRLRLLDREGGAAVFEVQR